ncbi:hypothetical protein BC828DRAFT_389829 [Blastocladiella britannica]|nr:hypothetical protein BC828DRAFT_389829 [Blastocladiella britannica]
MLSELPTEILVRVTEFVAADTLRSPRRLAQLARVNREFYTVVDSTGWRAYFLIANGSLARNRDHDQPAFRQGDASAPGRWRDLAHDYFLYTRTWASRGNGNGIQDVVEDGDTARPPDRRREYDLHALLHLGGALLPGHFIGIRDVVHEVPAVSTAANTAEGDRILEHGVVAYLTEHHCPAAMLASAEHVQFRCPDHHGPFPPSSSSNPTVPLSATGPTAPAVVVTAGGSSEAEPTPVTDDGDEEYTDEPTTDSDDPFSEGDSDDDEHDDDEDHHHHHHHHHFHMDTVHYYAVHVIDLGTMQRLSTTILEEGMFPDLLPAAVQPVMNAQVPGGAAAETAENGDDNAFVAVNGDGNNGAAMANEQQEGDDPADLLDAAFGFAFGRGRRLRLLAVDTAANRIAVADITVLGRAHVSWHMIGEKRTVAEVGRCSKYHGFHADMSSLFMYPSPTHEDELLLVYASPSRQYITVQHLARDTLVPRKGWTTNVEIITFIHYDPDFPRVVLTSDAKTGISIWDLATGNRQYVARPITDTGEVGLAIWRPWYRPGLLATAATAATPDNSKPQERMYARPDWLQLFSLTSPPWPTGDALATFDPLLDPNGAAVTTVLPPTRVRYAYASAATNGGNSGSSSSSNVTWQVQARELPEVDPEEDGVPLDWDRPVLSLASLPNVKYPAYLYAKQFGCLAACLVGYSLHFNMDFRGHVSVHDLVAPPDRPPLKDLVHLCPHVAKQWSRNTQAKDEAADGVSLVQYASSSDSGTLYCPLGEQCDADQDAIPQATRSDVMWIGRGYDTLLSFYGRALAVLKRRPLSTR